MQDIIRGLIPVAPTVFSYNEDLDLAGQRRVVDFLVDAGASGICTLANYSEQFSLTDIERDEVVTATINQAAGRLPVCVATSHYSARVAASRSRRAQDQGASLVMLMPPFVGASMKVDADGVLEYFERVAEAVDIPIMIQDAPMSPTGLSVELLTRLSRDIPQVKYAKIEVANAADKLRAVAASAGADLPGLYDGEEAVTLIPDLHAGAQGAMSSSMLPDVLSQIVRRFHDGECSAAEELWEHVLPLIQFENRQCGMRAAKILLKEGKVIASDAARAPLPDVHPDARRQLIELAKRKDALILRWA
ncbi:dihydrodipicolinate synthase family protein [Mycobacterium sp. URHB0044]|jgi:2-keto-3-deoxy-L-arabinonate dehydratase|uniref:dihydrodipicolinate synthase family protein n=1 Tax=Mycobacterium sp. URHB0044 TaxID=1380386 RepID=UPI00048BA878|nr:dihydrodipicolinate synthase family protein [Mycobacterium sp. URHB0044]